jgi:hypothetical protein
LDYDKLQAALPPGDELEVIHDKYLSRHDPNGPGKDAYFRIVEEQDPEFPDDEDMSIYKVYVAVEIGDSHCLWRNGKFWRYVRTFKDQVEAQQWSRDETIKAHREKHPDAK